jgi:hypothetical protein
MITWNISYIKKKNKPGQGRLLLYKGLLILSNVALAGAQSRPARWTANYRDERLFGTFTPYRV